MLVDGKHLTPQSARSNCTTLYSDRNRSYAYNHNTVKRFPLLHWIGLTKVRNKSEPSFLEWIQARLGLPVRIFGDCYSSQMFFQSLNQNAKSIMLEQ